MHKKDSHACKSLLKATLGVDVDSEPKEIFPVLVCNNCYRSMQRIQSSKESGMVLSTQLRLSSWVPHSESCPVCYCDNGSDKHKRRRSGTGRPCSNDISHLSREVMRVVNNINPRQYSNLPLQRSHFLPTPNIQSLLCKHCLCIPNRPLELLPCRHLVCISCITRITKTNILTCACSPIESQVVEPHPVVTELLGSLLLTCPGGCGQIIALGHLLEHQQSNCAMGNIPLLSQINIQQLVDSPPGSEVEQHVMGLLVEKFIPSSGSITYKSSNGRVWAVILG